MINAFSESFILDKEIWDDGLMDAVNTAMIFKKIKLEPDFKLVDAYESIRHDEVEHLSFNLGSLFEGLKIMA